MLLTVLCREGELTRQCLIAYERDLQLIGSVFQTSDMELTTDIRDSALHQLTCWCLNHDIYELHDLVGLLV